MLPFLGRETRDTTHRERIATWLLDQIGRLDDRGDPQPLLQGRTDEDTMQTVAHRFVDWLHQLALQPPDDPDAELARLLDGGILRSRIFAPELRPLLTGMMRALPYSRHRALRRTLLAARTNAPTVGDYPRKSS